MADSSVTFTMPTAAPLIMADSSVAFLMPTATLLIVADSSVTHNTFIKLTSATICEQAISLVRP